MLVWCLLFSVFQCSLAYWNRNSNRNNVCRSFQDYSAVGYSRNCWFNPDINTSPSLLARRLGYPLEKYKVTTEDGYILTLHRIPYNNTDRYSKRQPVLIQHGIGARALFWMLLGENSPALFLVNNGYDVWLSTARGAGYSTQHKYLTTQDPLYWNFSFHENGIYDLPAIIEFVANTTNQKGNIIYIGHSMGTTMSYVYSIERKEHADAHLKALISLSPVAFLHTVSPLYKLMLPAFQIFLNFLIKSRIYAIGHLEALHVLIYKFCGFYPTIIPCAILTALGAGLAPDQVLPELIPVFARYFPSAISVKTLNHFLQLLESGGRFQQYNYGLSNRDIYNSSTPPLYDVTKISLPVFLFVGLHDAIATENDIDILYQRLNRPIGRTTASKYYVDFAHNDFFLGKDLSDFYTKLLDVMINKIGNNYFVF